MPGRTGFEVQGLNQTVRDLEAVGVEVEDLKDAFQEISTQGAQVAASFAPEKSGDLRDDIRGNRAKNKAIITAGRARLRYAGPINYGWPARNIQPSGFMQKADEIVGPKAVQILEKEINETIQRKGLK